MTPWKYTDATNTIVVRTLDNGAMESKLVSALPAGETVLPVDPLTLSEKRAQIDAQRDAKLLLGVAWNTHIWRTDDVFQAQLTSLIAAFTNGIIPAAATVNVRTMDATPISVAMTLADLKALAGTVLQYVQGVYSQSWAEKDVL